jgi:hypothetical protein
LTADTTIRLRGHHLLCLLTYKGLGYSPAFVEAMTATAAALAAGATAEIIEGADDICAPLCREQDNPHCHEATVPERDRRALTLVSAVLCRDVAVGDRFAFDAPLRQRLRTAYAEGAFADACALCEWQPLCRDIAASGFADTLFGCSDDD